MKKIIQTIEETLKAISPIEMRKNHTNQGVLKYINPKTLLEN